MPLANVRSSWPVFGEDEIAAVAEVLRSGAVNAWTGRTVGDFEAAYARHLGRTYAIAMANGTVALEVALRALGIGPGDEVIVSPRSFFASAACVPFVGATPVFADVDPDTQGISADTIRPVLTPRTRAVIVVHLAGWPVDMAEVMALAEAHNLVVIEDCAQAHGAIVNGRPVGAFGDVAVFSFCQDKIITTGGEGGLIALDDHLAWQRAWAFKDHGKSFSKVHRHDHAPGFRWLHDGFGTNLRLTSMQAALGLHQLARLEAMQATRERNALALLGALAAEPALRVPMPPPCIRHAWYRAYAFVRPERLKEGWNRDRIMAEIESAGVRCFTGSCPEIYLERAFRDAGFGPAERLPVARALGETSLAFQVDPSLDEAAMGRMAALVREVMAAASEADHADARPVAVAGL